MLRPTDFFVEPAPAAASMIFCEISRQASRRHGGSGFSANADSRFIAGERS